MLRWLSVMAAENEPRLYGTRTARTVALGASVMTPTIWTVSGEFWGVRVTGLYAGLRNLLPDYFLGGEGVAVWREGSGGARLV